MSAQSKKFQLIWSLLLLPAEVFEQRFKLFLGAAGHCSVQTVPTSELLKKTVNDEWTIISIPVYLR